MKKLLLSMLLTSFTGIIQAAEPTSPLTITETFYGTKLINRSNNPCKGATIKVCGIRHTKYDELYTTTSYTLYEKTIELKDENEETISVITDYVEVPIGNTIQEMENPTNIPYPPRPKPNKTTTKRYFSATK